MCVCVYQQLHVLESDIYMQHELTLIMLEVGELCRKRYPWTLGEGILGFSRLLGNIVTESRGF